MYIAPEKLTKITVNARQATRIPVEVKTKNSKLSWYFTCTGGDIAFSVVFQDREVLRFFHKTRAILRYREFSIAFSYQQTLIFNNSLLQSETKK